MQWWRGVEMGADRVAATIVLLSTGALRDGMTNGPVAAARAYYRALDDHDYDALAALLTAEFVHDRPDMTIEGCERFVAFMRDERPQKDTSHRVETVLTPEPVESDGQSDSGDSDGGDTDSGDSDSGDGDGTASTVAVRGRLLAASGDRITGFVDVFSVRGGEIRRIETYTD